MSDLSKFILMFNDFRLYISVLIGILIIITTKVNKQNVFQARSGKRRFRSDLWVGGGILTSLGFLMWWAASQNIAEIVIVLFCIGTAYYSFNNPKSAKRIFIASSRSTSKVIKTSMKGTFNTTKKIIKGE